MIRTAALCLLVAAAILPDLATAQSDWNPTDLEDAAFIGIIAGSVVLLLIILLVIGICCCCFMCPGLFGNLACCGRPEEELPYFEPPPQYYPPPPPEPEPYPLVISQPPPPEPVYIVKSEPEPRRERVAYVVRDRHERSYDNYYDRRVVIRSPGPARRSFYDDFYYDDRRYDDRRYRPTSTFIRRGDYY